jgi:plasmid stabilization system protein ParE
LLEPRIADKKIAQIRREIFSLSEYNNYPPVATRGFGKLHKMLVGKYNVFFIKNEYMRIIHVLHVIHTLRNWQDIV